MRACAKKGGMRRNVSRHCFQGSRPVKSARIANKCAPRMPAGRSLIRQSMQLLRRLIVTGMGAVAAGAPAVAADFYQGKTLTVIVGYAPGGGVDTTARAVTRHLGRFIPGNPAVTVQN